MEQMSVAVTGAAGNLGYSLVYRIAAGDMLPGRRLRLRLLETPERVRALEGVAMELDDCAFGGLDSVDVYDDPARAFEGANLALLVGSRPRGKGMERRDLLAANAAIFAEQGRALARAGASDLRVVVVGNPANTNALIAARHADGMPPERFTALTRLDHERARAALAAKARRPLSSITRMTIWGNHSATQYPDLFHARIDGVPAVGWLGDDAWRHFEFIPAVANRGAAIIAARGSSSAASAANAVIAHTRDLYLGTPPDDWTSMAVVSDGSYGVPAGLVSSFPCTATGGDWRIVPRLAINAYSRAKIDASVAELAAEAKAVAELA